MNNPLFNFKIWVGVALCSALVYSLYWLFKVIEISSLNFPGPYLSNLINPIAQTFHFIGLLISLLSVYQIWGPPAKPFSQVKRQIFAALLLEGIFYLLLAPFILSTLIESKLSFAVEALVYGIQSPLMASLLIILSLKVKASHAVLNNRSILKWSAAAILGFITSSWVAMEILWLDVIWMLGFGYITSGITYVVFFNSAIILSLAQVFALLGLLPLIKKGKISESTKKWVGISLILIGVHFMIFLLYAIFTNNVNFALSIDIWVIPFMGLGLSLLKK